MRAGDTFGSRRALSSVMNQSIQPESGGCEWLVDAAGCDPGALRSRDTLAEVFAAVVSELGLTALKECWEVFPGAAGVTGLMLLSESHLTVHTFPEHGTATFNLYCCRARPAWAWSSRLEAALGAQHVLVRVAGRG